MIRFHRSMLFLGLAAATALPSVAGDTKVTFDAGVALVNQLDSAKNVTNANGGFALTGAAYWSVSGGYVVRTGLGYTSLNGASRGSHTYLDTSVTPAVIKPWSDDNVKTSLSGVQVYGDLMIPTGVQDLSLVTGLSLNKWSFSSTIPAGRVNPLTGDAKTSGSIRGYKFGGRLGLQYKVSSLISAELLLQQTEMGSNNPGDAPIGNTDPANQAPLFITNENPGWLQLGVRFHF